MRPDRETRIEGRFEGWNPNKIYKLADGSKWRLAKPKSTQCARLRPTTRIWRYERKYFMELVESGDFAEVFQVL